MKKKYYLTICARHHNFTFTSEKISCIYEAVIDAEVAFSMDPLNRDNLMEILVNMMEGAIKYHTGPWYVLELRYEKDPEEVKDTEGGAELDMF